MKELRHALPRPPPTAWVGIDISKDTLDACLLPANGKPRCHSFRTDASGQAALLAWTDRHAPGAGFCLESTAASGTALATTLAPAGRESVERTVAWLEGQAERLQGQAEARIAASEPLRADRALLESIPGVGPSPAPAVLAELPSVGQFPPAEAAAYAGLAPRPSQAGTTVRKWTRLSKAGNARLRKALDLPTLTAIRFNPRIKAL